MKKRKIMFGVCLMVLTMLTTACMGRKSETTKQEVTTIASETTAASTKTDETEADENSTEEITTTTEVDETSVEATTSAETTEAPATEETTVITTTTEAAKESSESEEIRPEIKEALDSYEEFFDDYCSFMKKYKDNPADLGLIADYAGYISKYADFTSKISALDDGTLNDAELKYYLEVTGRVSKKLIDAAL